MAKFAEFAFVFAGGVKLRLPPSQYGYELRDGVRCMGIFNNEHSGAVIGGAPRGAGVFAPRSIVPSTVEEVGAVSDEIRFGARVDVQLLLPVAIHIVTRGTTVSSRAGVNGAVVARCEN